MLASPARAVGRNPEVAVLRARLVSLGDVTQFPPCFNRWRTTDINETVEHASFVKRLCGHNRVHVTQYRRGDDPIFFRVYTSLIGMPVDGVKQ